MAYSATPIAVVSGALAGITPTQLLGNGGPITGCTISPTLPSTLSINSNCVISGTPTAVLASTQYAVTATNSAGSTTATLTLSVISTPTLTYAATSAGTVGTSKTVTPATFSTNGSALTGCSVSPTLPSGLTINASTCVISGTPAATGASTVYTVTATNAAGSTNATVTFAVNAGAPAVTYTTTSANTGTVTAAMSVAPSVLAANGAAITNCTISPSLPSPLTINSTTCVISGTPTATLSSTTYTVTVTNSVGSSTGSVTLNIVAKPYYLYFSDTNFGGVYSCGLNASTGQMSGACNSGAYGQVNFRGLSTLTSSGVTSLYAADLGDTYACSADTTGALSCQNGASVDSNFDTRNITMATFSGHTYAYALEFGTNATGKINVCPVSSPGSVTTSCSVTTPSNQTYPTTVSKLSGSWFPASIDFNTISGTITGYVVGWNTSQTSDALFYCTVPDVTTGALGTCTASTNVTGSVLAALTSEPSSYLSLQQVSVQTVNGTTYAYLVSSYNIYKCTITGSGDSIGSCVLSQGGIPGYPTTTPASWQPQSIAFSNLGGSTLYAYVTDELNHEIYVCSVATSDGSLTSCTANPIPVSFTPIPWGIAVF